MTAETPPSPRTSPPDGGNVHHGDATPANDDDDDDDVDGREIPDSRHQRDRPIDGYAVELIEAVADMLDCRVEFYPVDDEQTTTRRQQQQQQSGWASAAFGRPGGWAPRGTGSGGHQPYRTRMTDYGPSHGLVEQLTVEVGLTIDVCNGESSGVEYWTTTQSNIIIIQFNSILIYSQPTA